MRTYVITTGVVFVLLTLAHVWRAIVEGPHVAADPWFVLSTAIAVSLSVWAWYVLRRSPRP
jgi:hypothetical protein